MFTTIVDLGELILSFIKDTSTAIVNSPLLTYNFNDFCRELGVAPVPTWIPLIGTIAESSILSLTFGLLMFQLLVVSLIKRVMDIFT